MNELTIQMQQIMHPRAVLVAYECETTGYSIPRSYLELRPVNEKGRMGAGIPVTYEFMNSLVESYTESMRESRTDASPGTCSCATPEKGRERYIWYNPPQKRKNVLPGRAAHYKRDIQRTGRHLRGGTGMHGHTRLQGNNPRRADRTVSGTVLQCNRGGRLPGQLIAKETAGHGFS